MAGVRLEARGTIVNVLTDKDKPVVLKVPSMNQDEDWVKCYSLVSPERAVLFRGEGFFYLDTKTGKRLHSFGGINGVVRDAAPSPGKSRRLLLAGGDDQVLRHLEPRGKAPASVDLHGRRRLGGLDVGGLLRGDARRRTARGLARQQRIQSAWARSTRPSGSANYSTTPN